MLIVMECRSLRSGAVGGLLRILTCVKRGITVNVRHADCRGMSVIEVGGGGLVKDTHLC